jgi:HEAT repeat protein
MKMHTDNTHMTTMKTLLAAAVGLAMLGTSMPADAGRGSSTNRIRRAIQSDVPSAIVSELEKAEYLWCAGCIDDVMQLIDHPEYTVREVAAWWFARRPAQKKELTERSIALLAGSDSVQARNAADVLGTFRHPQGIEALSAAVVRTDFDAEARMAAARALGTIGHAAANPALAAAMGDTDATVRVAAVNAWLAIRKQADAAPVVALVKDSDAAVRRAATSVVGNLRESSARADLEDRLANDEDPAVRRNAAWALGRIGDPASRSALEAAQNDESGLVRGVARAALSELR